MPQLDQPPGPQDAFPKQISPTLVMVRVLMRTCRAKARLQIFEACALLQSTPDGSPQVYADALLRALEQALPSPPVIYSVKAPERSFDECWLLSLLDAIRREDHASAAFLLRTRLPLPYLRSVGWLAAQLVARLEPPVSDRSPNI